ncbi:MAG: hypothetical protein C5B59_10050 [Bacteroidetes bacterium]|nr:MAG: hypothetical protein C5B59_10050 [Bacteroidota bacterium]
MVVHYSSAQDTLQKRNNDPNMLQRIANTPNKSGLSYEALTKFFQSSVTTGDNGGFNFKTTWFGISKLVHGDKVDLSDYYLSHKGTFARNFEISAGVFRDSSGSFSNLVAGIKYAAINHRSKSDTVFINSPEIASILDSLQRFVDSRANSVYLRLVKSKYSKQDANKKFSEIQDDFKNFDTTKDVNVLPAEYVSILDSLAKEIHYSSYKALLRRVQDAYDRVAKMIDLRGLLTFSFNPGYNVSQCRYDTTTFAAQYIKGIGKNYIRPWTFNSQLQYVYLHDSSGTKYNLNRQVFVVSTGFSKTLLNDKNLNPVLEVEPAFEYNYVSTGRYSGEKQNKLFFIPIIRIHVSSQLMIPVTIKYDLVHPRLFGAMSLTWNFRQSKQ